MDDDVFIGMHETLFAALGKEGFLRTTEPCQVELREGEQLVGDDGTVVGYNTTADIWYKSLAEKPRVGDALTVGTKNYELDFIVHDDGYSAKWVVTDA